MWQVGAQNAGKSSLINAMRRAVGKGDVKAEITTAAVPGTTLGAYAPPSLFNCKASYCLRLLIDMIMCKRLFAVKD